MATPLHKRYPRELRNNLGKYAGLFLMFVFAVSFVAGFLLAASSIEKSINEMRERYNIEDGRFTTSFEASYSTLQKVQQYGCTLYENFSYELPMAFTEEGQQVEDVAARLYKNRTEINLAAYAEGRAPEAANEVALDRVFMANHNLQVGSEVTLAGQPFTIVGVLTLPDYQALFESNTDFMFNALTFTVGLVSEEGFATFQGRTPTYTYSFLFNNRTMDQPTRVSTEEDMATAITSGSTTLEDFIDYADNQGIGYALDDVEGDQAMWIVLLIMLVVIMSFVFAVLTGATIEAESAVIGTLLASGYRKPEIIRHYFALPMLVGVVACVVGLVLAFTLVAEPMKNLYYNSYSLPPFEQYVNPQVIFITTVLPLLILAGITLVGLLRKLGSTPLQFLRHETGVRMPHRSLALPERLSFGLRFKLRVFLRNLSHFVTLFFGIWFASMLLLFGICIMPTVENYANSLSADMPAEHEYFLKAPLELEGTATQRDASRAAQVLASETMGDIAQRRDALSLLFLAATIDENEHMVNSVENAPEVVAQAEKFASATVEVERRIGGTFETVTIYGIPENSHYWQGKDVSQGRIVAGGGFMQKTKRGEKDSSEAFNRHKGENYQLYISSATDSATDMNLYMSLDTFNELFGNDADYFSGWLSNEPLELDEMYVATELTPADMQKMTVQMQDSMGSIVGMIIAMAVPIYLILVFLLTKTVIDRSARSISYMKVFGYHSREVNGLYLRPITVVVVTSLLLSLPTIVAVLTGVMDVMFMRFNGNFPIVVGLDRYAMVFVAGVVSYVLVAFAHMRRIRRVPLSLAMKATE